MGCKVIRNLEIVKSVDFTILQSVVLPISDEPLVPNGRKTLLYDAYAGELHLGTFTDLTKALKFCRSYSEFKRLSEKAKKTFNGGFYYEV